MSSSTLANALVAAQKEMPAVERDATNPHFRSSYTSLDRLIAKTKPVLTKHGLAIVQHHETSEGVLSLRTVLHHVSGEALNCGSVPLVGASDMQKLGAATTYARRYAWACLLGIADEDDDDGNSVSGSGGDGVGARRPSPPEGSAARTDGNRGSAADTGQRSPQAAGPDDPGSFVVNFSKNYKGRGLTLAQIYYDENDQGFVKWIAEKSTFEDAKQAALAYLVNPTAPGGTPGVDDDIPF